MKKAKIRYKKEFVNNFENLGAKAEFSRLTGVSAPHVTLQLNGKRPPNARILAKILKFGGFEFNEVYEVI